ncbi:unnamed protein product [Ilex paraguariensis]|uniref:SOSEKI DIX-like domain-containing protein n=1 Tax=Ilex paraguariensis TaxID=185542 RepID=A0ABC8UCW6_9AQUA
MLMATSARVSTELLIPKKWYNREITTSPERTKIWVEPKSKTDRRVVPVVYYLCRNGHLEHPHFVEVSLSSSQGLYLKDVTNRLNFLRGKGMADMYSWSSKRSYKNRYVWHDLSENDLIHPINGHEYVLKGSELLLSSMSFRSYETASSVMDKDLSGENFDSSISARRRKNQSWSSIETPHYEYRVHTAESSQELAGKVSADVGTQTGDEKRRRRRSGREEYEERKQSVTELNKEELSPPSVSASESVEGVSGLRDVNGSESVRDPTVDNGCSGRSGRMKAYRTLMQLISCVGSVSDLKSKDDTRYSRRV